VHAGAVQRIGEPARETIEPGLRRAVDVVRPPDPHAGDRGEHHDLTAPGRPKPVGDVGEGGNLRHVVGVQHGSRVLGIVLGASLVTKHPEREDDYVGLPVLTSDQVEQGGLGRQVISSNSSARTTVAPASRITAASASRLLARRAASTTVRARPVEARRQASATPISLRPPRTSTVPVTRGV